MGRIQKKKTESQIRKKKEKIESSKAQKSESMSTDAGDSAVVSATKGRAGTAGRSVTTDKEDSLPTKGLQFFREAKAELDKVTWPSRQQTIASTGVVIVLVIILALFLGIVDLTLSGLIRMVLS